MKKTLLTSILIVGLSIKFFEREQGTTFFISSAEAYGSSLFFEKEKEKREKVEKANMRKKMRLHSLRRMYENKGYQTIFFITKAKDAPSHQDIENKCENMDSVTYVDLRWREIDPANSENYRVLCLQPD